MIIRPNGVSVHARLDKWLASKAIIKAGFSRTGPTVIPFSDSPSASPLVFKPQRGTVRLFEAQPRLPVRSYWRPLPLRGCVRAALEGR